MRAPEALVIDDDFAICELTGDVLRIEGIDAIGALRGRQAIQVLDGGRRPSIIFLDLLMPDLSGEDMLPLLRQHPAATKVPIVAMSASLNRLHGLAADALLEKPFDLDELYDIVGRLCCKSPLQEIESGCEPLDEDHRHQVRIADGLVEALRPIHEKKLAEQALEEVSDFTERHFIAEAAMMKCHDFPQLPGHVQLHAAYLDELRNLATGSRASPLTLGAGIAVRDTIVNHIQTMDWEFARYLSARGEA